MLKIRAPKEDDLDEVYIVGLSMHAESYFNCFDFNRNKIAWLLRAAITNPDFFGRVWIDTAKKDKIVGYMMFMCTEHYFGYDKMSLDMGVYLLPEYRGSAGMSLIKGVKEYEKWAEDLGVKDMCLGVSAGITDEQSIELYKKLGYTKGDAMLHKKVHANMR